MYCCCTTPTPRLVLDHSSVKLSGGKIQSKRQPLSRKSCLLDLIPQLNQSVCSRVVPGALCQGRCPKTGHPEQGLASATCWSKSHIKEEAGEEKQLEMEQSAWAFCLIHRPQTFPHMTKLWISDETRSSKSCSMCLTELPADQSSPYTQTFGFRWCLTWIGSRKVRGSVLTF